jgi:hypothetical protein
VEEPRDPRTLKMMAHGVTSPPPPRFVERNSSGHASLIYPAHFQGSSEALLLDLIVRKVASSLSFLNTVQFFQDDVAILSLIAGGSTSASAIGRIGPLCDDRLE